MIKASMQFTFAFWEIYHRIYDFAAQRDLLLAFIFPRS
jgi:hypothetical protein